MPYIYELKINLENSEPKIWRRIQVHANVTFSELHDIIQDAMGWEHDHLYEFKVGDVIIHDFMDEFDDGDDPSNRDSLDTCLNEIISLVKTRFAYVYDFGDNWEHSLVLEAIKPEEEGQTYPVCIGGEGSCPPEDCGGIWGYMDLLDALRDKKHPRHDAVLNWLGEDWDAEGFDCDHANATFKNYAEQWEDIQEETRRMMEGKDDDEAVLLDEDLLEIDGLKFASPEDVLSDVREREQMDMWLEGLLADKQTLEHQTLKRLRDSGLDDKEAMDLIHRVLAIEWYYDLKYGIERMTDRYAYNLHHLPELPRELPRMEDALHVLNTCARGVPFSAIEYLQNDPSEGATLSILNALKDHSGATDMVSNRLFWYALAAEGHLCRDLIDPVIQLYLGNATESDWLADQGQYLIGKLAERFPDQAVEEVLDAMEKDVRSESRSNIFYLFDVFYFGNPDHYKGRLLALLEHSELSWYDMLTGVVADLKITESLPILKRELEVLDAEPTVHSPFWVTNEIREAIAILEGEIILEEKHTLPLCLTRDTSWKEELLECEAIFYEEDIHPFDGLFSGESMQEETRETLQFPLVSPSAQPYKKEKTPGRNDPCPCGSGKKYKKCCMNKSS